MGINKLENKIYSLAKKQNQIALKKLLENEDGITDYFLELKMSFYIDEHKIDSHTKDLKPYFLNDTQYSSLFKINNLAEITHIDFDINVSYQYKTNIQTT